MKPEWTHTGNDVWRCGPLRVDKYALHVGQWRAIFSATDTEMLIGLTESRASAIGLATSWAKKACKALEVFAEEAAPKVLPKLEWAQKDGVWHFGSLRVYQQTSISSAPYYVEFVIPSSAGGPLTVLVGLRPSLEEAKELAEKAFASEQLVQSPAMKELPWFPPLKLVRKQGNWHVEDFCGVKVFDDGSAYGKYVRYPLKVGELLVEAANGYFARVVPKSFAGKFVGGPMHGQIVPEKMREERVILALADVPGRYVRKHFSIRDDSIYPSFWEFAKGLE